MHYGLIKVAAATPTLQVADCVYNSTAIIELMREAVAKQVKAVIFPELALTGYSCGDLFLQPTLLEGALAGLAAIVEQSKDLDLLTVVGLPLRQQDKLYNCAVALYRGKLLAAVPKTWLPNYNEFYEQRHFVSAAEQVQTITLLGQQIPFGTQILLQCQQLPEFTLALEICEDLWTPQPPSINHVRHGAYLIGNLSASNEIIGKMAYRKALVQGQSARLLCGYIYANAGADESTTDVVFSGHNLIGENGTILAESPLFSTGLTISEIDLYRLAHERQRENTFTTLTDHTYTRVSFSMELKPTTLTRTIERQPFVPDDPSSRQQRCEMILLLQAQGLKKRLAHTHSQTAVIGISGGLDSCLALLAAAKAMDLLQRPRTDIVAVTMPCFGTTARTKSNAELLCQYLGVQLRIIDIGAAVKQHFQDISHDFTDHSVTFENSQARERTQVLMDIANQTNGLVIGTGDLSELALGWATYNGDHMSMYGVNGSIPKTLVRHIVRYVADTTENPHLQQVLLDILDTPVSPELLPAAADGQIVQKTEDLVGPYELHDFFLYYAVRWSFPPRKIFALACHSFTPIYQREFILHWLKTFYRRFFQQQFKRSCLPDGPKVGSVALSPRGDWRMPSDAAVTLWLNELETL